MSEQANPTNNKPLVLVVDDNPDLLSTLEMLIGALGGHPVLAASGRAALDSAREQTPDIVLLDIGLPDMDGYEVARRLRGELGLKRTYLVGLSGHAEDEERSHAAGFDYHQLKPIPLDALQRILQQRKPG